MMESGTALHAQLNAECDPRLEAAAVRYTLDGAHNRRRFQREGVALASGGREFYALSMESRNPIYARPAYHPEEPDATDIALAQIRDASFAALAFLEHVWTHRNRYLLRLHRAFWLRDTTSRLRSQWALAGGAIAVILFALFHHGY